MQIVFFFYPNTNTFSGCTALHTAVRCNYPEIVKLLLQYKPDICYGLDWVTPVYIASEWGHVECLKLLLEEVKQQGKSWRHTVKYIKRMGSAIQIAVYWCILKCDRGCMRCLLRVYYVSEFEQRGLLLVICEGLVNIVYPYVVLQSSRSLVNLSVRKRWIIAVWYLNMKTHLPFPFLAYQLFSFKTMFLFSFPAAYNVFYKAIIVWAPLIGLSFWILGKLKMWFSNKAFEQHLVMRVNVLQWQMILYIILMSSTPTKFLSYVM